MSSFNYDNPTFSAIKQEILNNNFHNMDFVYKGVECELGLYYFLDYGDTNVIVSRSIDEIFAVKVFDGRTFEEAFDDFENIDVLLWE